MKSKRILIVDDEVDLCQILKFNLDQDGFEAHVAYSGEEAIEKDLSYFDIFLFDVMMDGINGFELLQHLRLNLNLSNPVVFITALTNEESILEGFQIGADDYIKKPFSVKEVVARINVVYNRSILKINNNNKQLGLKIDDMKKQIIVNNQPIVFTKTEYDLFILLFNHPGKVYSRDEILKIVWTDEQYVLGRTVDVNVTRIRKKLGSWGKCIMTRSGYGYYFNEKAVQDLSTELKVV